MIDETIIKTLKDELLTKDTLKEKITIIAKYAKKVTTAERCSLFIFNKEKDQLQSIYADGVKGTIALKSNIGIVGYAFHKKTTILENNTNTSNIFFKLVDKKTHYKTSTVLAVPLINDSDKRLGVIELLNKENGFTDEDKLYIETFATILIDLLQPNNKSTASKRIIKKKQTLQEKFDHYLDSKRLYLMENGSAYYKVLGMKRDYFIAADQCYLLDETDKQTHLYYYTIDDDFLSLDIISKIDNQAKNLLISENIHQLNFISYALEDDDIT